MTGQEMRTAREAAGLTQEALALRLGVTPTTVWRWEAGQRPIKQVYAELVGNIVKEASSG